MLKKWLAGHWKKVGLVLAALLLADLLASALFIRSAYSTLEQHASPGPFDLAVVFFSATRTRPIWQAPSCRACSTPPSFSTPAPSPISSASAARARGPAAAARA